MLFSLKKLCSILVSFPSDNDSLKKKIFQGSMTSTCKRGSVGEAISRECFSISTKNVISLIAVLLAITVSGVGAFW